MSELQVGSIVARKSYGSDIFFKVIEIKETDGTRHALLKGLDVRLYADAPVDDLVMVNGDELARYWHRCLATGTRQMERAFARRRVDKRRLTRGFYSNNAQQTFSVPGQVLHLDGDRDYLELCLSSYKQLGITAYGYALAEDAQPRQVVELLRKHRPDILVLTGHDGFIKERKDYSDINNYHHSRHFVAAVQKAREHEANLDDLVIFAGACQSHYEAILAAGANFASSPERVLIHAYDPVFVVEKIAFTSIYDRLNVRDIILNTITGIKGIGGIDTRGKFRTGLPKSNY